MFPRAFLLLLVVACVHEQRSEPLQGEELLTEEDQRFCRAELELNYPDVDVRSCMIIPQEFREKISKEWGPPMVRLTTAEKEKLENEAKAVFRQERIKFTQRKGKGCRTREKKHVCF